MISLFNPLYIFKCIKEEEKRMERSNERNEDYQEILNNLKTKRIKSHFEKLIETQLQIN